MNVTIINEKAKPLAVEGKPLKYLNESSGAKNTRESFKVMQLGLEQTN
jgi:hypothetical protein